jgi:hypothetical protein
MAGQPGHANVGKLERGHVRIRLLQDLALSNSTGSQLAVKYGVSQAGISQFKARHADEIAKLAAGAIDALQLLWVTDKAARLAAYESAADGAQADTEREDAAPEDRSRARRDLMKALRSVAEELPDGLPARSQVVVSGKVEYVINGADPAAFT